MSCDCTFAYWSVIPPTHCPKCGRCLGCGYPPYYPQPMPVAPYPYPVPTTAPYTKPWPWTTTTITYASNTTLQ